MKLSLQTKDLPDEKTSDNNTECVSIGSWERLQEEGVDQADFLNVIMFDPDVEDE